MIFMKNDFYFYYENFCPDGKALIYFQVRELSTVNCMFKHSVIDFGYLSDKRLKLSMTNNGTESCQITILNLWTNETRGLRNFWTTSKNDVKIFNFKQQFLKFNKKNAKKIKPFFLNSTFYRIFLPSETSLTIESFVEKENILDFTRF